MNSVVSIVFSGAVVTLLALIPLVGVWALDLRVLFGVVIPYAAVLVFFAGLVAKVINWGRSPVPFRIPTTAGQQWSLPWIKANRIDNPKGNGGVALRMIFEVLLFRSLFRNTRMEFRNGPRITYEFEKWLWLFALAFHYAFLVILLRHLRFFTEPIPFFVKALESLDGFMQMGIAPLTGFQLPNLFLSGPVLMAAVGFLFLRRVIPAQMRYLSMAADYFPLFLIGAIGLTGILMRYLLKVDIVAVKELTMGLVSFQPTIPGGIGVLFYIHLFLVCVLLLYFPFSKLVHLGGVFLSPTRNLANNSRAVRHVNPWSYPVKTHTYEEYEDEFRDKMVEAELPVEKAPETEGEASQEETGEKE
jgi:nitrate reductase gamma subunit